jgi:hypothetical protein
LGTQGGGHGKIRKGHARIASIAKPFIEREDRFYKRITNAALVSVIPKYVGCSSSWLLLQDLTAGMTSPCVGDLKLGTRSFEVTAAPEKAVRQLSHIKGTTTLSHAIRCIDICIRRDRQVLQRWDRRQGRLMTSEQLEKVIRTLVPGKRRTQFRAAIKDVKAKLIQTYDVLPNLRLYSASVLIIYDGDRENGPMYVKIIDFAHAYIDVAAEGGDPTDPAFDDNALKGLDSLISFTSNR